MRRISSLALKERLKVGCFSMKGIGACMYVFFESIFKPERRELGHTPFAGKAFQLYHGSKVSNISNIRIVD